MPTQSNFKKYLYILLAAGLLIRFIFVFAIEQVPVMWDARIYSSAALGLLHYVKNSDRFGHPELDSSADSTFYRAQFETTMRDNIQGEQIEWLYYDVPTVTEAHDYLFLSGPVYPTYLAALFYVCPDGDFMLVRILNVLIDTLCMLLMMLIARELLGNRTALLAGLIYVFYLPFILFTGMVSPEPLTMALILLTTYLILSWYNKQRARILIDAGIALGLLALLKPTAVLLFVPFGIGVVYDYRGELKKLIGPGLKAAVPFIIVILPWLIITSIYFGQLSIRDPDYSKANIRSSSSIEFEGYDLDYTDEDFWTAPVMESIAENPVGYAGLLIKKFLRLWQQPYNDYRISYIFSHALSAVYHFLIVIAGLFGIFMFLSDKRKGLAILFLIPAYYTAIHIIFHALARYNLNAMPFMIVAAAAVYIRIYDYAKSKYASGINMTVAIKLALFVIGGLIVFAIPAGVGQILAGSVGVVTIVILKIASLLLILYYLYKELSKCIGTPNAAKYLALPALILLLITSIPASSADRRAEWKCRLDKRDQIAGVKIFVPEEIRLRDGDAVRIGVDMTTDDGRREPFGLIINGQRTAFRLDQPPISEFYYQKMTYNVFQTMLDIGPEEMPAWRFIPLNHEVFNQLLDQDGCLEIAVDNGGAGFVDLRGGYNLGEGGTVKMPSLTHSSIERYVEKNDPRIWVEYNLSSDSSISYYIDDIKSGRYDVEDLSLSAGRQTGRYRIILEIKRLDGARYYF